MPEQLRRGSRLDDFEIIEKIGYGAFSDVYWARDPEGRDVVLKCPHEVILGDTATFDRFRREMRIADRLDHPGIQRSLDTHAKRSRPYMVMEYVDGESMRQVLAGHGPLPASRALDIARQVTGAIAYAHGQGVCHRDLKPENILVAASGRVAITDFGIALMEGARRLTSAGSVPRWARRITWPRSRSRASEGTRAPTSTPSVSPSTRCSPAACPGAATTRWL